MNRTLIALMVCGLLHAAPDAEAQTPPDADARKRSDAHFQEGARLYHAGEYSQSILELKEGYELAPHPVFLVNIALAYARLENWDEAAKFGHRATTEEGLDPGANAQTGARASAWSMRAQAEAQVAAIDAAKLKEPVVAKKPVEAPQRRRLGPLGWSGIATAGVGLAAVGTTIVIGATLEDERTGYEAAAAAGDRTEYDRLGARIDNQQRVGRILLYSGTGLIAVGGGLLIFDLLKTESASVALTPGGVSARWSW